MLINKEDKEDLNLDNPGYRHVSAQNLADFIFFFFHIVLFASTFLSFWGGLSVFLAQFLAQKG